jgi:hypothetical protein
MWALPDAMTITVKAAERSRTVMWEAADAR